MSVKSVIPRKCWENKIFASKGREMPKEKIFARAIRKIKNLFDLFSKKIYF